MNQITYESDPNAFEKLLEGDRINEESRRGSNYYCEILTAVTDDHVAEYPEDAPLLGTWLSDTCICDHDEGMIDRPTEFTLVEEYVVMCPVTQYRPVGR